MQFLEFTFLIALELLLMAPPTIITPKALKAECVRSSRTLGVTQPLLVVQLDTAAVQLVDPTRFTESRLTCTTLLPDQPRMVHRAKGNLKLFMGNVHDPPHFTFTAPRQHSNSRLTSIRSTP
jgi:hypothetical protein